MLTIIAAITVCLLVSVFCIVSYKSVDKPNKLMQLPSELMVIAMIGAVLLYIGAPYVISETVISMWNDWAQVSIIIISSVITGGLSTYLLYQLVEKLKLRIILRDSLFYKVVIWVKNLIGTFLGKDHEFVTFTQKLQAAVVIFLLLEAILVTIMTLAVLGQSFIYLLFAALIIVVAVIFYWSSQALLNKINEENQQIIAEQIKAERMKIELVTNVSHDLRTPLTAINSYIDLLAKEKLPKDAKQYVTVLEEKSRLLNFLVTDLFDLAKATSGNLDLAFERVDIYELVEQTIAEMSTEIESARAKLVVQNDEQALYIMADGAKLYRALANLLDNSLKYAQGDTRIFVKVYSAGNRIMISIQNTANYEMNFTSEEISSRFVRGDQARSTEGSGLGLSIAQSFVEACKGNFNVHIDGDMFKVTIDFPLDEN